jgi:hypothetical protein
VAHSETVVSGGGLGQDMPGRGTDWVFARTVLIMAGRESGGNADHVGPRALRRLLDAVLTIGSDLDLASVLSRIVEAAVDLVGARYGALGVLDENGTGLSEFITVVSTPRPNGRSVRSPRGSVFSAR